MTRAMAPLYDGRAAAAGPTGQEERFGHVVFVNDVFFCAYEVLRCVFGGCGGCCWILFAFLVVLAVAGRGGGLILRGSVARMSCRLVS